MKPTPDDVARDLLADLAVCEAASQGPWSHGLDDEPPDPGIEAAGGGCVAHVQCHGNYNTVARTGEEFSHADARFIAASRAGWPAALRRALAAEAELERLARRAGDAIVREYGTEDARPKFDRDAVPVLIRLFEGLLARADALDAKLAREGGSV